MNEWYEIVKWVNEWFVDAFFCVPCCCLSYKTFCRWECVCMYGIHTGFRLHPHFKILRLYLLLERWWVNFKFERIASLILSANNNFFSSSLLLLLFGIVLLSFYRKKKNNCIWIWMFWMFSKKLCVNVLISGVYLKDLASFMGQFSVTCLVVFS